MTKGDAINNKKDWELTKQGYENKIQRLETVKTNYITILESGEWGQLLNDFYIFKGEVNHGAVYAIGTFICPGIGTAVGAGVGALADIIFTWDYGEPPKSIADHVKDGIGAGVDNVTKWFSTVFW